MTVGRTVIQTSTFGWNEMFLQPADGVSVLSMSAVPLSVIAQLDRAVLTHVACDCGLAGAKGSLVGVRVMKPGRQLGPQ